jgi:O-antigen ligase
LSDPTAALRGALLTGALALLIFFRLLVSGTISPSTVYLSNAGLAALLLLAAGRKEGLVWPGPVLAAGLISYFLAGLLSGFGSLMMWSSLAWLTLQLGHLLLLLAVLNFGREHPAAVAGAMLAAGAISAAYAANQRLGGFERTLAAPGITEFARMTLREGRVFGLTFSPDMLAGMLSGLLPLALALAVSGRGGRDGVVRIGAGAALAALFAIVLWLTRSLGGLLAAGAGVGLWAVVGLGLTPRRLGRARFGLMAGAAAAVIVAGGLGLMAARGGPLLRLDPAHNPMMLRLDNWRTALAVWKEFPLSGAGGGQYGLAMKLHRSLIGNEAKHVHDTFLEVLAETGPLGLAGVVMMFLALAQAGAALAGEQNGCAGEGTRAPTGGGLRAGLFAGGAAVGLHGLIDFDWAAPEVIAVFWIALAAAGRPGQTRPLGRARRWVVTALMLMVLVQLYQAGAARPKEAAVEAAQVGDWEAAKKLAERALAWNNHDGEMYSLLAREIQENEPGRDGAPLLRRAIAFNPRYPYHYRDLGFALARTDPAAAEAAFRHAVALYPNSLDLNLILGRFLSAHGKLAEAEPVLNHARACHFVNGEALLELGLVRVRLGRESEGEADLRAAARERYLPSERALAAAAELDRTGRRRLAQALLQEWTRAHPGDPARERMRSALEALGP